jgi:hypothetical protein
VVHPQTNTISGSNGFSLAAIEARSCRFDWELNF